MATDLDKEWKTERRFDGVLAQLDRSSSPGWPLMREAPTIGKWLYKGGLFPDPNQRSKLWKMVQDVFAGTYEHVFKVFIKVEPHTQKKVEEGRWRLILMSSLPYQIAWHMTVGHLEASFLQTYHSPLAHSLVYFGGGWKTFKRYVSQHNMNWCCDKSGWDWNSPGWVYDACLELRKRLTCNRSPEWESLLTRLYSDAYGRSRVYLPDGTLLEQLKPGLMKSGLVVTITDNGISQVALHLLASYRQGLYPERILATGDDTIQAAPKNEKEYVEQLQRAGCVVKEYGIGDDFMGFSITRDGFYPKYLGKHLMSLRLQKEEFLRDALDGYMRIYACNPEMVEFFQELAGLLGVRLLSPKYYLYFANNPDAFEAWMCRAAFRDHPIAGDHVLV